MRILQPINLDNWRCPIASLLREIAINGPDDMDFYSGSNPREDEMKLSEELWAKPHLHRCGPLELAGGKYDLVHHASVTHRNMLAAKLAKVRSGGDAKHVFTANLEIREEDAAYPLFKKAVLQCDALVAVSETVKADVKRQFGRTCDAVIPNGYDPNFFRPGNVTEANEFDRPYILWVGTIEDRKRPDILLAVAKDLPDQLFVMAGPLMTPLRAGMLSELESQANIRMLGSVGRPRLRILLRHASALLFPSGREGLPLSVIEALGMGVPVLGQPKSSIPELVEDGQNGYLLDAEDPPAWGRRIREIAEWTEEERSEWRERVQKQTESKFGWKGIASRYHDFYRKVANEGPAPAESRVSPGGDRDVKVCLLTNMVPPYRASFFRELSKGSELLVICDTKTEHNRSWDIPEEQDFAVAYAKPKTIKWKRKQSDMGFSEVRELHVAFDYSKILGEFEPDVIVSGELGLRSLMASNYARRHNIPFGVWWEGTRHTERAVGKLKRIVRRRILRRAKMLWSNGKESTEYAKRLGCNPKVVVEAMTGLAMEELRNKVGEFGERKEELKTKFGLGGDVVLLFVGAITGRKGVREYMEALEVVVVEKGIRNFQLAFVGDGELKKELEQFVGSRLGMKDAVFTGFLQPADSLPYFAVADWLVLPTLEDNFPLVTLESIAAGVPQLYSIYNGAHRELQQTPEVGKLFDPKNIGEFADTLESVIRGPNEKIPGKVVDAYVERYSPAQQAARAFEAIEQICGEREDQAPSG